MINKNKYQVIIGLGNPGEKYSKTRHNVGFIILDKIQKSFESSNFKFENKFNAEISEKKLKPTSKKNFLEKMFYSNNNKIFLLKPQSFMNKSGEVIKKFMDFYKLSSENIIVIHDDLDLTIGNYKISENSGAGGHNGIQNIVDNIGTQKFKRIRIGIEKKEGRKFRQITGEKFVLQNLSIDELLKIDTFTHKIEIDLRKVLT